MAAEASPTARAGIRTRVSLLRAIDLDAPAPTGGARSAALQALLALADVVAGVCAGVATAVLLGAGGAAALALAVVVTVGWVGLAFVCGLYSVRDLHTWASGIHQVKRLLFAALLLSWAVYPLAAALDALHNPATGAMIAAALTVTLSASGRAIARAAVHRMDVLHERAVVVGSGVVAGQLADKLRLHPEFGVDPIGVVDDDVSSGPGDLPVLGSIDVLPQVIDQYSVDRVFIAFSRSGHAELLSAVRACRDRHVPVHVVPRLFEFLDGVRSLDHIGGLPVLTLGLPQLTPVSRAAKRALDVTLSAALLLALAPLLALLAAAIKLDSPGPLLFRQSRAGRGDTVFELLKFRSMHVDADDRKRELLDRNDLRDGVMFKMLDDPRVTRVGRLLRRLSLDELPQLWNVLRGEMSLVGPRPLVLPESDRLSEAWHLRRRDLRPGLTGPWQIYGRSNIPFQDMVRFDYQYVGGWSLARDLEILLATLPAVLSGRGAY